MNGERRTIGEHLTAPRKVRVMNSMRREMSRLRIIHRQDGMSGVIQFAVRTYKSYGHAHRLGREYRYKDPSARGPRDGYGLEYRYELLGSRIVLRKLLKKHGVSYV